MFYTVRKSKKGSMYGHNIESDRDHRIRDKYWEKLINSMKGKEDFKIISDKKFECDGYIYSKGSVF